MILVIQIFVFTIETTVAVGIMGEKPATRGIKRDYRAMCDIQVPRLASMSELEIEVTERYDLHSDLMGKIKSALAGQQKVNPVVTVTMMPFDETTFNEGLGSKAALKKLLNMSDTTN